ncbi:MAG: adenosine deaminase [Armatimonadetes bacterium]|nr:adenosine deaminase [Armatimonadota bacterium]
MRTAPRQYAELHLHLGGAVLPRILYSYLHKVKFDRLHPDKLAIAHQYLKTYPTYERWEKKLTKPSKTLTEYLEAHKIVEPLQTVSSVAYMVNRLLRGCYVFENLAYLELRYNPYFRIDRTLPTSQAVDKMKELVATIHATAAANFREFPIVFSQILCMDSRLPNEINAAIAGIASEMKAEVCAVDLAGPDTVYQERREELLSSIKYAREKLGLNVTTHLFETTSGSLEELVPYCDRIGHGIQIPLHYPHLLPLLAKNRICLEICPTTYFRTGSIQSYAELRPVFQTCFDLGVAIAVCTDNSGLHGVRLPLEFERLLTHKVINFHEMEVCRENAFRHAFRWPGLVERRD